jgi:dephospho-CoA kinase
MRVLGLTGGIGSGKSTVSQMFAEHGAEVVDADQIAREVVVPGQPALQAIREAFGAAVIRPDGRLDRTRLGGMIFRDPAARARLNSITHPRIQERLQQEVEVRRLREGVLILDIPLLYETGRADLVEAVIVVWVDRVTQLRRLIERAGLTANEAAQRLAAQMSLDEKRARADYVIDNTGSLDTTRQQVQEIVRRYSP